MDQQKRMFLAIGLSIAFMMVWTKFFGPIAPIPVDSMDAGVPEKLTAVKVDKAIAAPPSPGAEPSSGVVPEIKNIEWQRPHVKYAFSSEGAGLTSAVLLGKKEREQQHVSLVDGYRKLFGAQLEAPPQMNMAIPVNGQPLPYAVSIEQTTNPLSANLRYEVAESTDGRVVFKGRTASWDIEKTFTWNAQGYDLGLTVTLSNRSNTAVTGQMVMHNVRSIDPKNEEEPSMFGGVGNQATATCRVGEDIHKVLPKADHPPEDFKGAISYAAIDQQYFLSALFPKDSAVEGTCTLVATPTARVVTSAFPIQLQPGSSQQWKFGLYLGPKDLSMLKAVASVTAPETGGFLGLGAAGASQHPHLEKTVDFGWWTAICKVLLVVLQFFHKWVGNWGLSIILLTFVAKLALLPLTHKAMVSAEAMKKLQPQMEVVRKKFANDKERLNLETMKLYQEAKVNPIGGCLPLLLQLPIWGALFTTLRTSYDLYGEPFMGPIWTDLTYKDPTFLLPAALLVTMIITQRAQPQMMDAAQAKLMIWVMPVFFTAMMMNYPFGLSLYIVTNNLLSILQQFLMKRYLQSRGTIDPTNAKPAKA